jgi:hypothetical protein
VEEKWFQLNQYHGFDYTFVSPWPESQTHGLFLETLMTSLKQGGLDVFTYRTSTHGVGINRDARVVIKVRVPMKRLEAYASSTGYRFLLSKVLHLTSNYLHISICIFICTYIYSNTHLFINLLPHTHLSLSHYTYICTPT